MSKRQRLRDQLLRRVQVDKIRELFRGIDYKVPPPDNNKPKRNTTFAEQETMVDFLEAYQAKFRMTPNKRVLRDELPCSKCHKYSRYCECE